MTKITKKPIMAVSPKSSANLLLDKRSISVIAVLTLLMVGITFVLYKQTEELLIDRLQERMIAIASTAAVQFDTKDISYISGNLDDIESNSLRRVVNQLQKIRSANDNIRYTYIMERTGDPNTMKFLADADTLSPISELDENQNGALDEEEMPPMPGDDYDATEYPVLKDEAFYHPSVDRELQADQWGLIMAAYAPVVDENQNTIAIIGIDVLVNDFNERTQATFLPFALFSLFLIFVITLLSLLLIRVWKQRVNALQELDRQKDELLSIVSHQLATPVTSIKWYLELMLGGDVGKLKDEQMKYLESMQSISADLADLVSMILDVSRIQLGRMKVDRQPLDLNDFFGEVLTVIRPKAEEKKQELTESVAKQLPTAMLDKRLMRMTVENLLSNAVKYTPDKGKVTLHVEVRDKKLYCEVRDTGLGIPKQEQSRMFERLYRASNVRNTIDGNGFGLYVAKGAVESQDGRIWFESTEGKGTTFFIEWPLIAAPKADTQKKTPKEK